MLFSSLSFLFLFLPILLILYFAVPKKFVQLKNFILLIFSLIFYSWGEPKYILLMFLTVIISYGFGLLIEYFDKLNKKKLKLTCFIFSIVLIVGNLLYFKYTNFFINNINSLFSMNIHLKNIVLPIGISFYTFQILSYIIDLYLSKIKIQKNFFNLFLYISFFPQLIAGPIVKYETIEDQLTNRKESLEKVIAGAKRFIIGLAKKVIIANNMALIADTVYNSVNLNQFSPSILILGILAYTFQIYFDFSGYSDMAIGLGKIFGFEFLENFNYPYMATSIKDFWNRWHISLTTFFREYIYIPLGGNRVSKIRWILNMSVVWLLTGFWHGASWNFIIWGVYYLVLLLLEKLILEKYLKRMPKFFRYIITFILVNIGWIIFRVNNLNDLIIICRNLFKFNNIINLSDFLNLYPDVISSIPYIFIAVLFSFDISKRINSKLSSYHLYNFLKNIFILIIFILCIIFLISSMYNPFIYFRF